MGLGYKCGPKLREDRKAGKVLMAIKDSTVASILWLQNRKAEHQQYLREMFDLDMSDDSFARWVAETRWREKAGIREEPSSNET